MPRKSKIVYDPALTLKQNAEKNGVSIDAIKYFVKTRGIDREGDRQAHNISLIREARKTNPDASKAEIAKLTGLSVKTISKYLPAIESNTDTGFKRARREIKPLVWEEGIPEPKNQKRTLMSKRLMNLPALFQEADLQDIRGLHDFIFLEPGKPMLFIGNGGMMSYVAPLLYEMNCGIARCITPLELAAMSDETIKACRCLLFSASGGNMDIKYAANRLLKVNPENTASFSYSLVDAFKNIDPRRVFCFKTPEKWDGFISVEEKFYRDALLYRAFTGNNASEIRIDTSSLACYQYRLNNSAATLTPLRRINHFVALFSDYGEPAAHDFESVLVETGIVSTQVCDYRNYCHGRFIFVGNHTRHTTKKHTLTESDVAVILFITPRNKGLVKDIREKALAKETPVVLIETEYNDARATLDLLIKSNVFLADYEEKGLGINPCDPENYNAEELNKRIPKNGVRFSRELACNGPLRYETLDEIVKLDAAMEEVERQRGRGKADNDFLLGTIAGDMIGKPYERQKHSIKTTDFPLFSKTCKYTDDSVLTIAVMDWLMTDKDLTWGCLADRFVHYGTRYRFKYQDRCFSNGFTAWLKDDNRPFGRVASSNGAAMRVSPVGWFFNSIEEVERVAEIQATLTHNHPIAIVGAKAAAVAVFLARKGKSKEEIKEFMTDRYGFDLSQSMEKYRAEYEWTFNCKKTTEAALMSFLWSEDFESAIRNAVSLGGDADTIGAITGSIAEAFYGGVPEHIKKEVLRRSIPDEFKDILTRFSRIINE